MKKKINKMFDGQLLSCAFVLSFRRKGITILKKLLSHEKVI